MEEYEFHELAEMFPLMGELELYELAKDIARNGLLEPIVLLDGKILDGRNRYKACNMVNCLVKKVGFDICLNPFDFIVAKNLHRRHLNSAQKAQLGLVLLGLEIEKGKERKKDNLLKGDIVPDSTSKGISGLSSRDKIAKQLGISKNTLDKWRVIIDASNEDEKIAEKKEKVLSGKFSIKALYNEVMVKKQKEELVEKAKDKSIKISGKIICGNFFKEINKVEDDSIDLLFVDPPYNILKEDWDTFESKKLFRDFCMRWLDKVVPKIKDTGKIYICSSQEHKYLFYSVILQNSKLLLKFNFGQEIIWHYENNVNKFTNLKLYKYAYEPIFYLYGKNADNLNFPHETFKDGIRRNVWTIATPQTNFVEGKVHPSQKPIELLRRIVLTGSCEDDLILDPFAGSGTTAVVCEKLKRNYIMIEKDEEMIQIMKGRIKGVLD